MVIYLTKFFRSADKQMDYAFFTQGVLWSEKANSSIYVNVDSEHLREFRKNPSQRKQFAKLHKINSSCQPNTWHYDRSILLEIRSENQGLVEKLTGGLKYRPVEISSS